MKGILWKYESSDDDFLRDKGKCSDPDFCCNKVPVWAICAPRVRKNLDKRDIVFFIPQKSMKNFRGYMCTGVLVVEEKIEAHHEILEDRRLSLNYLKAFRSDLRNHRMRATEQGNLDTCKLLEQNFIIGNSKSSFWLGRSGPEIEAKLKEVKLYEQLRALSTGMNQSIPHLKERQAKELYETIKRDSTPISPSIMRKRPHVVDQHSSCSHLR